MSVELTEYEVVQSTGVIRITVPSSWKVTYGPVAQGGNGRMNSSLALRFYENETKQRAIFTDVKSFRDTALPLFRKVEVVQGEDQYTYDDRGNRQLVKKAAVQTYWEKMNDDVPADQAEERADQPAELAGPNEA